jgi:hypothetical protein
LYGYYKGSVVVSYWMLIVMSGCMRIMKDLPLHYTEC